MILKLLIFYSVDAMTVYYVKEKRYQGGDMVGYFRSLYANVNEPEVCVVSSMALHVISDPDVTGSLWNKEFVKDAFANWLQKKIEELKNHPTYAPLMEHFKFGLHSYRKGGATFCGASEQCPVLALFLRACWYLGGEIDRYVFHSDGGDRKVARIAALLEEGSPDFACIPPRFNLHDVEFQSVIKWNLILPRYEDYPNTFKIAIPYLIAMAVYRNDWWEQVLPPTHRYFKSWFYTNQWYLKLREYLLGPVNFFCPITKIKATGVPAANHLMQSMREEVNRLKVAIDASHEHCSRSRRNDPLTVGDLQDMMQNQNNQLMEFWRSSMEVFKSSVQSSTVDKIQSVNALPQSTDYQITPMKIRDLFYLWYFGDENHGIPALYKITTDSQIKKFYLTKARGCISMLEGKDPYFRTIKDNKDVHVQLEAEKKLKEAMDQFCAEQSLRGVSTSYCFTKIYNHLKNKQSSGTKRHLND